MIAGRELQTEVRGALPPIVFTACDGTTREALHAEGTTRAASTVAGTEASARRQVMVNGRRARVIDVHAHCVIPETLGIMGLKVETQRGPGIGEVGARRIREMDEQGVDIEA